MTVQQAKTQVCIVGGGPAGVMLGFLLARAGVDVVVLEKHQDFFRDFRGDTIHPSTLEVMHELGLLDDFLKLPHQEAHQLTMIFDDAQLVVDFTRLPTRCTYIAMMPQWDFLNFLAQQGARYPGFTLMMQTEGTGLIEADGRVAGVRAPQKVQVAVQNNLISKVLGSTGTLKTPMSIKIAQHVPGLRYLAGRMVGLGVRPEHVQTPDSLA